MMMRMKLMKSEDHGNYIYYIYMMRISWGYMVHNYYMNGI